MAGSFIGNPTMRRAFLALLTASLLLTALCGCGNDREKGINRDKDRPKANRAPELRKGRRGEMETSNLPFSPSPLSPTSTARRRFDSAFQRPQVPAVLPVLFVEREDLFLLQLRSLPCPRPDYRPPGRVRFHHQTDEPDLTSIPGPS